jgi:Skp family chaperone for outer membrane proteins
MTMKNAGRALLSCFFLTALAACSSAPKSDIGLIDVQRIMQNWPKFQNYQNQLAVDAQTIERSNKSAQDKARMRGALQQRYNQDQTELYNDVTGAAKQVAASRNLKMILTRQFVGYGGVDVTPDIEKILKIDDKSTPAP